MTYSSIIKKSCKCGCGKMPTIGYGGYYYTCNPERMQIKIDKHNKKQRQASQVRGLIKTDTNLETKGSMELNRWFEDRIKELTGVCKNCGGKTKDYSYRVVTENLEVYADRKNYDRHYVAHILPKAYFPSVATHPDNWIELCFHGKSCHTQMDNKMLDLIDMNCFSEIVDKFVKMYPSIATIEKRRIPAVLMQYVEVEK